jgi:HAMP domain-containing protein
VLVTEAADVAVEKAAVLKADADVDTAVTALKAAGAQATDVTERDRSLLAEIDRIEAKYSEIAHDVVGKALAGQKDAAITRMNLDCRATLVALLKATSDYIAYDQELSHERVKIAEDSFATDRMTMVAVSSAAVLIALALGWMLASAVTRPLERCVVLAEAVASGDLSSDIVVDRNDETGKLLAALSRMNVSLVTMVGQVRLSAEGIATASSEIASGNHDLSSRTEQQASALQQTAASKQQMTSTVQQSADSARAASQLAAAAADVAGKGGAVVQRVVTTMSDISASSKKIGDIIGTMRRHRLPDQHPGVERRGGGGACRRTGPRLRGGGVGSAQPGAALGQRRARDQGPHRRQRRQGGGGHEPGGRGGLHDGRRRRPGTPHDRPDGRDQRVVHGTDHGHHAGEPGRGFHRPGHAAERRAGGRKRRGRRESQATGRRPAATGGRVQAGRPAPRRLRLNAGSTTCTPSPT